MREKFLLWRRCWDNSNAQRLCKCISGINYYGAGGSGGGGDSPGANSIVAGGKGGGAAATRYGSAQVVSRNYYCDNYWSCRCRWYTGGNHAGRAERQCYKSNWSPVGLHNVYFYIQQVHFDIK